MGAQQKRPAKRTVVKRITSKSSMHNNTLPNYAVPTYPNDGKQYIAIIQPGCWGDNINSTLMLRPMRNKYPDATIDVYTSTKYASAFHNNKLIDHLFEHSSTTKEDSLNLVHVIPPLLRNHGYTLILNPHPMINPDKWTSINNSHFGDNLICAWIRALEENGIEYTTPLESVMWLTDGEIHKVDEFCKTVAMEGKRNIMMETYGESGQTQFNYEWAEATCRHLANENTNIFVSRGHYGPDIQGLESIVSGRKGKLIFIGDLSIRECAHIFNKCDVFISVSSGLSNACNTTWCKKAIKWFEVINSPTVSSAPIRSEGKVFWYPNDIQAFINKLKENGL